MATGGPSGTLMQITKRLCNHAKFSDRDFKYSVPSLHDILNTPDDMDHCFYIVCEIDCSDTCTDKTEQLSLSPQKRNINDNELGYRERLKDRARTENLFLDQNNNYEYIVH